MKSINYCRVSTKEQDETGFSLPAQQKLLEEYGNKKGFTPVKTFSVSESASGKQLRKHFSEMLEYAKRKDVKVLVFEKVDRVTRNLKEAVMINEWLQEDGERQIHSVKDGIVLHRDSHSQEKFNWNIRTVMAQNYIDNLSEEVKKGQKEKIATGWYPSGPILGYRSEGEKGRRIHVPDEKAVPYIVRIFEQYATGLYSTEKLAVMMNQEGMLSKRGKPLNKRRIYDILINIYYTGKFKWNGKIYPGNHEAIISEDLYNKVQEKLHGKSIPLKTKKDFLFRGLIKCGHCGSTIGWETHKGHTYGHCNYHYTGCDQRKWLKEEDVFADVAAAFTELAIKNPRIAEWVRKSLKTSRKDETVYREHKLNELNTKVGILEKRLDRLYMDRLDEVVADTIYREKFSLFTAEKAATVAEIKKVSEITDKNQDLGVKVFESAQVAKSKFKRKLPAGKRAMLSDLCEKLEIHGGKAKAEYTRTFKILQTAVVSTNSSENDKLAENSDNFSEPIDFGSVSNKKRPNDLLCAIWRSRPGSNR